MSDRVAVVQTYYTVEEKPQFKGDVGRFKVFDDYEIALEWVRKFCDGDVSRIRQCEAVDLWKP